MSQASLKIQHEDGQLIVGFQGSLHGQSAAEFKNEIYREIERGCERVILDFSQLDYLSSAGIGLVVSILNHGRQFGSGVIVCGLQGDSLNIFRLTRLDRVFEIHPTLEDALVVS